MHKSRSTASVAVVCTAMPSSIAKASASTEPRHARAFLTRQVHVLSRRRGALPVAVSSLELPHGTAAPTRRCRSLVNTAKSSGDPSFILPRFKYTALGSALKALRLSGGAGKKREAPSPRAPAKKHAASGSIAEDGDGKAAEAEETPDTSRNWDVQKVVSESCACLCCLRIN